MQLTEDVSVARPSFVDRIGIYPPLVWGFVGLLLFMIGDGVESGFLSRYLVDRGLSPEGVAWIFTVYGFTVAIAESGISAPFRVAMG